MNINASIEAIQQNPTALAAICIIGLLIFVAFIFLKKKKESKLESQVTKEMAYDWGREEIRKHTVKDLDKLSRFFVNYKKILIIGGMVSKVKVGNTLKIMNIKSKEVISRDQKTGKNQYGEKDIELYICKFKMARWESLDFFPFNWLFVVKKYLVFEKADILEENLTQLRLKCDEFTQVFDIYVPLSKSLTKIAKVEEFVFKGFSEELTGRLQNLPAKIAQYDLKYIQELGLTEKRAEVFAKTMNQNPTLKPM